MTEENSAGMTPDTSHEGLGLRPCAACEVSRANAKAAGHRDWSEGVCGDCAWTTIPDFPDVTEADIRAACREMKIPYVGPAGDRASAQLDLFGAAA